MTVEFPPNVKYILDQRYFFKDATFRNYYGADGIEDWQMLSKRVAKTVSKNNLPMFDTYYELIHDRVFLPNSPTLFGAGIPGLTLSACYVIGMEDSIEGWSNTFRTAMKVQTMGGGCGFPLHKLRHHGARVAKTNAKAAGPIEFMHCWNEISKALRQAVRNGANMGLLACTHPDLEEFISCKDKDGELSAFNISVGITNEFMRAVESDSKFDLTWNGEVVKTVMARRLWNDIIKHAWKTGEPGLVFIDHMNENNPWHSQGQSLYPNPCQEANLFENSACNLGSINLTKFVLNRFTPEASFDLIKFSNVIKQCYTFLDDLIDVNNYPTVSIEEQVARYRQIGLGVMGLADVFIAMGVRYGSPESIELIHKIMKIFKNTCDDMNAELATRRGKFPMQDAHENYKHMPAKRNFTVSCVAPTGTISQIAGCSSGVEPHFALGDYDRIIAGVKHSVKGPEIHPTKTEVNVDVQSNTISVQDHLNVLAAVQQYIEMSVSKTINLPSTATPADVEAAYMFAYKSKCKGITVYRDGSRENQTLQAKKSEPETVSVDPESSEDSPKIETVKPASPEFNSAVEEVWSQFVADPQSIPFKYMYDSISPIARPDPLTGLTKKYKIGCGNLYTTVNYDGKGHIVEVFVRPGKYGGCSSNVEALGRLASLSLRSGTKVEEVIEQLRGIRCMSCLTKKDKGVTVKSCSDAIGNTLEETYGRLAAMTARPTAAVEEVSAVCSVPDSGRKSNDILNKGMSCPSCDMMSMYNEGSCWTCKNCAYSKCG